MADSVGSGPEFRRQYLIVSANPFNESRINTVIAVVITSNLRLAHAPGNVSLSTKGTGLSKPSVANVSQVITIDKSFLTVGQRLEAGGNDRPHGGGGASTSRLPLGCTGPTTPALSISSTSRAARL